MTETDLINPESTLPAGASGVAGYDLLYRNAEGSVFTRTGRRCVNWIYERWLAGDTRDAIAKQGQCRTRDVKQAIGFAETEWLKAARKIRAGAGRKCS